MHYPICFTHGTLVSSLTGSEAIWTHIYFHRHYVNKTTLHVCVATLRLTLNLHAKSKKTPTKTNIFEYKENKKKNLTNQRIEERDYSRKQFDLQTHDMGKTCKVIRTLLDKDAGINVCKTVDFIIDNRLVCDYNVISNTFNDYFVSIVSILANSIHCNVNPLLYVDNSPNSIVIPDISHEAVISVTNQLKILLLGMMICPLQ